MSSSTPRAEKAAAALDIPDSRPAEDGSTPVSQSAPEHRTDDQTTIKAEPKTSESEPAATSKDSEYDVKQEEEEEEEDVEEGEVDEAEEARQNAESESANPPLPAGPPPPAQDDGWDFHWDASHQAYYFFNRFTGQATWENPRVPTAASTTGAASSSPAEAATAAAASESGERPTQTQPLLNSASLPQPPTTALPAGGYNPAIHGDYDPNAWYAKSGNKPDTSDLVAGNSTSSDGVAVLTPSQAESILYAATGTFNRFTGGYQDGEQGAERHTDEAKNRRQMNAFFDVDAAANQHDGRSLRAERSGIKPSKKELKRFKEKRRAKKEEKRRAWLKE